MACNKDGSYLVINPFPGIPLIKSPLFVLQRGSMGLTKDEERIGNELNERGYAILDFPDPQIDARIDRIKENLGRRGYGSALHSAQDPFARGWGVLRDAYGASEEAFLARKAQALIWFANLLHGGSHEIDLRPTRWSQVTHYYFEDCIYYTPAFSDEALGRLALGNLTSIADGQPRPNTYLREKVERSGRNERGLGQGFEWPQSAAPLGVTAPGAKRPIQVASL